METNYYERDLTEILCLEGILVVVTDTKKKKKPNKKLKKENIFYPILRLDWTFYISLKLNSCWAVVVIAFNPSTWQADAGGSLSYRPV